MFWQRLKELRESCGLTQDEMSERLSMAQSTYSRYENDLSRATADIIVRVAREFAVSADWLLKNEK